MDYERLNETVLEGTVLTYQCDNNGLSLTGPNTITCTNAGVWSTEPDTIMCAVESEYSFVNGSHQYLRFSTDPITAPLFTGATIADCETLRATNISYIFLASIISTVSM